MAGRATVAIDAAADRVAMIGPYGVQLWDVPQGRALIESPVNEATSLIAISSAGDRLSTLDGSSDIPRILGGVWRRTSGGTPQRRSPTASIAAASRSRSSARSRSCAMRRNRRFSPPFARRSGSRDSSLIVQVAPTSSRADDLALVGAPVTDLAVDSAANRVAVALEDGRVKIIALGDAHAPIDVATHAERASAVALSPNGIVASGGSSGDVQLAVPVARPAARLPSRGMQYSRAVTLSAPTSVASCASPSIGAASVLASGDEGGTVRLWSVSPPRELCSLEGQHADYIRAIAFAPSGKAVATADERGVALWFVDEGAASCHFGYRLVDLEAPTEAMRFAARRECAGCRGARRGDSALRAQRVGTARFAPRPCQPTLAWSAADRRRSRAIHQVALVVSFFGSRPAIPPPLASRTRAPRAP